MTKGELLTKANKDLEFYYISLSDTVMGEDGKMIESTDEEPVGYALVNKITGITEHTSVMLPGVLWQATHFETTLKSLLEDEPAAEVVPTGDDILPFGTH